MTESKPLISVLMTAYNRENYIAEAIQSVLDSNYQHFELIIVDDCSTDKTVEIARSFAVKDNRISLHINEKNLGDYPNRNKAASLAKGVYLKYFDSDDKLYPFSLDIMVKAMTDNPDVVLALCYFKIQDDDKPYPILFSPKEAYYRHFFLGGLLFAGPSGSIIQTAYFRSIGGFSGKRYVSDTELWLKIVQQSPVLIIQPSLIWWRRHEGQEFNLGHVNEDYVQLNYELNQNFLETPFCPLDKKDQERAIRNYKNRFARKIINKIIKGKFAHAVRMKKYSAIATVDIFRGLIPANKIKSLFQPEQVKAS